MKRLEYGFVRELAKVISARTSRLLTLTGNVNDLFHFLRQEDADDEHLDKENTYLPLMDFLAARTDVGNFVPVVYELNGPIRFVRDSDKDLFRDAWVKLQTGMSERDLKIERFMQPRLRADLKDISAEFEQDLNAANGNSTLALEMLRWMCLCSRTVVDGEPLFAGDLVIIVEGADMIIPAGSLSGLSDEKVRRIAICNDWFGDLGFMHAQDTVVFITESRGSLHDRVANLPQLVEIEIASPGEEERAHFIDWFIDQQPKESQPKLWNTRQKLAEQTAGLTVHALQQLLLDASHSQEVLGPIQITSAVERYIISQLGEGVVEFHRPAHSFEAIVGNTHLKSFLVAELIPGMKLGTRNAIASVIVAGPNGAGKDFVFEAVFTELDCIVMVLMNLRSKWFGETDLKMQRLKRLLYVLSRAAVFVPEADTQIGSLDQDAHETEKRLLGTMQQIMSDTQLRGKIIWVLITARPEALSPDIRRAGRGGDAIIAVFDPEGSDRQEFLQWAVESFVEDELSEQLLGRLGELTPGYSAGDMDNIRRRLARKRDVLGRSLTEEEVLEVVTKTGRSNIGKARRLQTLIAVRNCTDRDVLPPSLAELDPDDVEFEILQLQAQGIR